MRQQLHNVVPGLTLINISLLSLTDILRNNRADFLCTIIKKKIWDFLWDSFRSDYLHRFSYRFCDLLTIWVERPPTDIESSVEVSTGDCARMRVYISAYGKRVSLLARNDLRTFQFAEGARHFLRPKVTRVHFVLYPVTHISVSSRRVSLRTPRESLRFQRAWLQMRNIGTELICTSVVKCRSIVTCQWSRVGRSVIWEKISQKICTIFFGRFWCMEKNLNNNLADYLCEYLVSL